jgi:MFS family permease
MNAVYFFSYFQRVAIPGTVFDELQGELRLTAGAVALLSAVFLYVYGGMQFFVGVAADRFGAARVFLVGGAIMTAGALVFPLSHSAGALYASRALVGLGCSLIYISVVKAIDELFEDRHFGVLLGVALFLGYSGGLFGTYPFAALVQGVGWRRALLGMGGASAVALAVAGAGLARHGRLMRSGRGEFPMAHVGQVLRNRAARPLWVAGAINFSLYFVIQATIGKKLLSDALHLAPRQAAWALFAMMLTSMITLFLSGFLVRLAGNRYALLLRLTLALSTLATGGLLASLALPAGGRAVAVAGCVLLAGAAGLAPVFTMAIRACNPPEASATAVGVINAICYLGIALLAHAAGWILDRFEPAAVRTPVALVYPPAAYRAYLVLALALAAVGLLATLRIREPPPAPVSPVPPPS